MRDDRRRALYTPQQKSRYLLLMLGAEGARLTADCPAVGPDRHPQPPRLRQRTPSCLRTCAFSGQGHSRLQPEIPAPRGDIGGVDGRPAGPGGALQVPRRTDGPNVGRTAGNGVQFRQGPGEAVPAGGDQLGQDSGNFGHGRSPPQRTHGLLPPSSQGCQSDWNSARTAGWDKRSSDAAPLRSVSRLRGDKSRADQLLGEGPDVQHLRQDGTHCEGLQSPASHSKRQRRQNPRTGQRRKRNLLPARVDWSNILPRRSSTIHGGGGSFPRRHSKMLGRGGRVERELLEEGPHGSGLRRGPIDAATSGLREVGTRHAPRSPASTAKISTRGQLKASGAPSRRRCASREEKWRPSSSSSPTTARR